MKLESIDTPPTIAPYGSWKSPITADFVTSTVVGLSDIRLAGDDVYWLESRPSEKGRSVVVRLSADDHRRDMNPDPFNARTRVHEYGGASYLPAGDSVYFSNFSDNKLYVTGDGAAPRVLSNAPDGWRFADFLHDRLRNRLIAVAEVHTEPPSEPQNYLVGIGLDDGAIEQLAAGADFYASPTLSPDGSRIAWLSWNLPNMPWDGTLLWTASIGADGSLLDQQMVAGGVDESIFQPQWSPDGTLYYVSDRNGWWNIYRLVDGAEAEPLWVKDAEFGEPQWVFGQSTYAFGSADSIICSYTTNGVWYLASVDLVSGKANDIETPYTVISSLRATDGKCCFIGASPSKMPEVVCLDMTAGKYYVLKKSSDVEVPPRCLSVAEPIQFPTADGQTAFANYYPPKNDEFLAPDGELPPLLVACHGGPTSASYSQLSPTVQYWTSRGFAFVHVNYGGSTGYGREYTERLNGNWGIVDVDDCVDCALYLAEVGKADPDRLTIHGGSAGGYTALCALTFHEVFAAGASLYGVSGLAALAQDTHKFESRYLDRLIGPYPEREDLYRERSPVHFADRLSAPVIFFQGLDDKVVPPDQAIKMVDALKQQNIPVAYVPFEGEGHGFRKSDSIKRYLEAHLDFYAKIFNITPADPLPPVDIMGLIVE